MACGELVLISTVDVFKNPRGVDESTVPDETGLHPYGLHRRLLEKFVETRFPEHLIVRLPGLVGSGLRKNIIFDFLNNNGTDRIDSRGLFQFYPMKYLWSDIRIALDAGLKILHLTAEPVSVAEVAKSGFGLEFDRTQPGVPARYDFRTRHAAIYGGSGDYQYNREQSLAAIAEYAQAETRASSGG